MTTTPRRLNAPAVWSQPRASLRTAQASHAFDTADLANDAASGRVGQRATILRNTGGTFHCFWHPSTTARFLEVAVTVAPKGTWVPPDGVTVNLSVTDGAATVTASTAIPSVFRSAAITHPPGLDASRASSSNRIIGHLDRTALDATLNATLPWRLTFALVCTGSATACVEAVEVAEVARFALDSTETYGDIPSTYLPRGLITDALSRTGATLEAAYDWNRRTYHALSLEEGTPDAVTAAAWAAIPGSQTVTGTTAAAWKVRPRRILSTPAILFGVRYKTSGATAGDVRITTSVGTYTLALPGTSGAWADVLTGAGFLADAATDTITWEAQVGAGTLSIASYWVVDAPT